MWELLVLLYGLPTGGLVTGLVWLVRKTNLVQVTRTDLAVAQAQLEEARETAGTAEQGRQDALEYARGVLAEAREKVNIGEDVRLVGEDVRAVGADVGEVGAKVQAVLELLGQGVQPEAGVAEAPGEAGVIGAELREEVRALRALLGEHAQSREAVGRMAEMLQVSRGVDSLREEMQTSRRVLEELAGRRVLSDGEVRALRELLGELAAGDGGAGRGRGQHRARAGEGRLVVLADTTDTSAGEEERSA